MYINPYNIINGIEKIILANKETINQVVKDFQGSNQKSFLRVYKGMRPTLNQADFPSLEIEVDSLNGKWEGTEFEYNDYSLIFTLTINTQNIPKALNFISTLTRKVVEVLTFPNNRCFPIPDEVVWNPSKNDYEQAWVQYGSIDSVKYSATNDGTIRVAQWTWTGKVIEGYPYIWATNHNIREVNDVPRPSPKDN